MDPDDWLWLMGGGSVVIEETSQQGCNSIECLIGKLGDGTLINLKIFQINENISTINGFDIRN